MGTAVQEYVVQLILCVIGFGIGSLIAMMVMARKDKDGSNTND